MSELAKLINSFHTSFKTLSLESPNEIFFLDEENQLKLTISSNVSKVWLKITKSDNNKDFFFKFCKLAKNSKDKLKLSSLSFWSGDQIIDFNPNDLSQVDSLSIESFNIDLENKNELSNALLDCLEKYNIVSSLLIDFSKLEGAEKKVYVKKYERSQTLRKRAIEIHGLTCKVCGFNFELNYGEIGKDFIHIHHLEKISKKGEGLVDPVKDLIPVCPNCHAMLHSNDPPITPEELKEVLKHEI
jgi:hypothetical protein